jgi:AraC family ethanolamine operon transcriptional activator
MKNRNSPVTQVLFPSFLCIDERSSDAQQMAEQSLFWHYEHKQFSRGKFKGRILAFHTSRIQISLASRSPGIYIRGGIPKKSVVISFPLTAHQHFHYRGKVLENGEGIMLSEEEEIEIQTERPSTLLTLVVCKDFFEQQCQVITGKSLNALRCDRRVLINPDDYSIRTRQLVTLLQGLLVAPKASNREEERVVEHEIMGMLLAGIQPFQNWKQESTGIMAAKTAETYILDNLKSLPTISEICRFTGTSERTFHRSFKERFGVSPKTFMQIMRLNGAHRDLLSNAWPTRVSDIAMEWGFYHLGRFARQYSLMFGELPRETQSSSLEP